jgi:hypothetical protein
MEASDRDPIAAALASLGIDADATDLAVIGAAQALFGPATLELLELDLGAEPPEPNPDLSRPPAR